MLVFLVRADGMKRLDAENADDRAENICLFKVKVDQLRRLFLDVADGLLDVQFA